MATFTGNTDFFASSSFGNLLKQYGEKLPAEVFIEEYLLSAHDVRPTEITPEADIYRDLGFDSLDLIELSLAVQRFFNLKSSLDDAIGNGEITPKVGEIAQYCEARKDEVFMRLKVPLLTYVCKQKDNPKEVDFSLIN